jgi:hypothetical protein
MMKYTLYAKGSALGDFDVAADGLLHILERVRDFSAAWVLMGFDDQNLHGDSPPSTVGEPYITLYWE